MGSSALPPPRAPAAPPIWLRLLPVLLIGALVVLGSAVEAVRFHSLLWVSKLPMALLLAWTAARVAAARPRREGGAER